MSDFEEAIRKSAERAVLNIVTSGSWLMPDYKNRVTLPPEFMREVWAMVDTNALRRKIAERIEAELAERMVNHMAAEMATDIKQILSVKERREALRALAREHMESVIGAGKAHDAAA